MEPALNELKHAVEAAGPLLDGVVIATVFLIDIRYRPPLNAKVVIELVEVAWDNCSQETSAC